MTPIASLGMIAAVLVLLVGTEPAASQQNPQPGLSAAPPPSDAESRSTHPYDQEQAQGYQDRSQLQQGRSAAKVRADATEQSNKLLSAMQLACGIADAGPVGRGKAQIGGREVTVSMYEVACANGLGYILVAPGAMPAYATSCFSADKTRLADLAAGRKPQIYCQLPANQDVKAMAAAILATAGERCMVSNVQWYGLSVATSTEYTEVACNDGRGYLMRSPRAGATEALSVMSCQEAARRGLACRLVAAAPADASH